jgi:asparagine synthase (glutamine-hydrolysing)
MCGIAGFTYQDAGMAAERMALLHQMCRVISHRGPDDQGVMLQGRVGLGMRRLSIIDLQGGRQPISNEDGSIHVVFNGEIYNYQDLRRALEQSGHAFGTATDTESIVHAYEEYGIECVEHLRGMFAFALWDSRLDRLFLVRDRAGKKPLYYTITPRKTLVFGSEIKSLLQHPEVARTVDPEALDAYLSFGYVPDPLCIFEGIHKVPPGHYVVVKDGRATLHEYWDLRFEVVAPRRQEEYVEELLAILDEAVRLRLIADVPVGAFLSGGIDSGTVVGVMARQLQRPVKTFSIGFHEDTHNELQYARLVAKRFGTEHEEFIVTPEVCQIVDQLAWHFDEPFADWSAIPTYMVSKLAREHVTVALSGDGGDELFAGYSHYLTHQRRRLYGYLPWPLRRWGIRPFSHCLPHRAWARNYLFNVSLDPVERHLDTVSVFTELNRRSLYSSDFRAQLPKSQPVVTATKDRLRDRVKTGGALDELLYLDSKLYLPGDILTKVDRASMAVSLEVRAPLLDHKLIEYVSRIPASLKLRGGRTKHILKEAAHGLLPPEVVERRKQGFGLPVDRWIRQELRDRVRGTLTDRRTRDRGYLDGRYLDVLLREHEEGRRDHSFRIWALFMLELWHRQFADCDREVSQPRARLSPSIGSPSAHANSGCR